jgi:signal transduction histidine kinase
MLAWRGPVESIARLSWLSRMSWWLVRGFVTVWNSAMAGCWPLSWQHTRSYFCNIYPVSQRSILAYWEVIAIRVLNIHQNGITKTWVGYPFLLFEYLHWQIAVVAVWYHHVPSTHKYEPLGIHHCVFEGKTAYPIWLFVFIGWRLAFNDQSQFCLSTRANSSRISCCLLVTSSYTSQGIPKRPWKDGLSGG